MTVIVIVIVSVLVMIVLIVTPASESVTGSGRVHDACTNAGYHCPSKTQPDRARYFDYSAPRPMDSVPLGYPPHGCPPLGSPTCPDYPHYYPRRRWR